MVKIVKSLCTENPCYRAGRKITVQGLMLHSVGCPQPKASVFINTWNNPSYSTACPHGVIDGDGTVYQTLPWNHRGWHCGSGSKGSGNNTYIGVEMCEPAEIRYTGGSMFVCTNKTKAWATAKRTYKSAVKLFALLCKKYGLNPLADGVIISHKEGCARGIATNHGDPEHLWSGLGLNYTMDTFRTAVAKKMGIKTKYKVIITADSLNVRKGPGTKYKIVKSFKNGRKCTIAEEVRSGSVTWGKLKSGIGYICLAYTQKI